VPPELTVPGPDGQPTPLLDLDGKPVQLAALRGKAVWLNFWASWCPPCQFETPVLRDVSEAYADQGLAVVGVSVRESSEANVRAYAEKYQLGYTIAADVTGAGLRPLPPERASRRPSSSAPRGRSTRSSTGR
jgi:thiol-disulfide isomerase/thioredoxin